jgi:hypothetical protein
MAMRNEGFELIFGPHGPGCSQNDSVLEIVERIDEARTSRGTRQSFSRSLEAWCDGPTTAISDLKGLSELGIFDSQPRVGV